MTVLIRNNNKRATVRSRNKIGNRKIKWKRRTIKVISKKRLRKRNKRKRNSRMMAGLLSRRKSDEI